MYRASTKNDDPNTMAYQACEGPTFNEYWSTLQIPTAARDPLWLIPTISPMNNPLHTHTIHGHRFISWALVASMILFALNSYPMMYPGYDFHFHLENFKFIAYHANNFWHRQWGGVFKYLNTPDLEPLRGLIVHRTQTFLTLGMLAASAYLFLGTALKNLDKHVKFQLATMAVVVWLMMHGTYSSPAGA